MKIHGRQVTIEKHFVMLEKFLLPSTMFTFSNVENVN